MIESDKKSRWYDLSATVDVDPREIFCPIVGGMCHGRGCVAATPEESGFVKRFNDEADAMHFYNSSRCTWNCSMVHDRKAIVEQVTVRGLTEATQEEESALLVSGTFPKFGHPHGPHAYPRAETEHAHYVEVCAW